MSKIVQEKFQITLPKEPKERSEWVSKKSVMAKKGTPSGTQAFLGTLPPGSDIEDQEVADIRVMEMVWAGESDVSKDNNPEARRQGYTRRSMRPTDDMYTNEHVDMFYEEITVDGDTGFLERGNLLDRN